MDKKQIKACIDYINANTAQLHGVSQKALDVGPAITEESVIDAQIRGGNAVLLVDRGIKGTPKYTLNLDDVEAGTPPPPEKKAEESKPGVKGK